MKQSQNTPNKKAITDYYEQSTRDYLFFYSRASRGMHYGYWDTGVHGNQQAVTRLNEVVAQKLKVTARSRVLDAGCGVGGSALWMAKNLGCSAVGISLSPSQIIQAKKFAQQDGVAKRTKFLVRDYTKTKLPAASFDGAFGIESVCYLEDKTPFYREMARVLKPGGRVAIADGLLLKKHYSDQEWSLLKAWLVGWVVPSKGGWKENHFSAIKKAGLKLVEVEDYSKQADPSARLVFLLSLFGVPFFWCGWRLGLMAKIRYQNALACYYQYIARRKNLWGNFIITAQKPE